MASTKSFQTNPSRLANFLAAVQDSNPPLQATPHTVIWKLHKVELLYFQPKVKKYKTPIFMIYSLINRPFILDLAPGESLIGYLVEKGYEVYLLDFGIPSYEDRDIKMTDYISKYITRGVRRALLHS